MSRVFLPVAMLIVLVAAGPVSTDVPEARFMFNKRCATCHDATALMPKIMARPTDLERRAYLDTFLARHHARDAAERALIIEYLLHHQPR